MITFAERLIRIKNDIRDLKTAQLVQSDSAATIIHGTTDAPTAGVYEWLITYKDDGETTPPLIDFPNINFHSIAILDYDPNTNTQKLQFVWQDTYEYGPFDWLLVSSREIESFTPLF